MSRDPSALDSGGSPRPLAIDLFCGLGGWTEGLLAEGWDVIGFDVEQHVYGEHRYPAQLVLQDVRTIHGAQFRDAALVVASPPCQEFSYMAMPWTRAKQIARALRGQDEFPVGYTGSRTIPELTALFDACFRIQREACEASGRFIPLVVENVKGAQPWLGNAAWHHGSFYLWGDVPALMPTVLRAQKFNPDGTAHGVGSWFAIADSKNRGASKNSGGSWFNIGSPGQKVTNQNPVHEGVKQRGSGPAWFDNGVAALGSKSSARKAASARIAKIPPALAQWIAHVYFPKSAVRGVA
jgi:hypothetical protein